MAIETGLRSTLDDLIGTRRAVLFMKGPRQSPRCGFSARVVAILDEVLDDYESVDVLARPDIWQAIKEYSNWPTIPQLYVDGKFVGGCDIVQEMAASGELYRALVWMGVPAELRVFSGEGHSFARPSNKLAKVQAEMAWLGEHLTPSSAQ